MPKLIFVNLPVADLGAARAFYEAVGAVNEPRFTDDTAAAMVLSDIIHVMLLTHDKFAQFTPKRIADAHQTSEVLIALSADSRAEVDAVVAKAIAAGGREPRPAEDHGWMYGRSFEDLDGHIWEPFWIDHEALMASPAETADA